MTSRTIRVDYLARVEGEGSLLVRVRGDEPAEVKLRIFEHNAAFFISCICELYQLVQITYNGCYIVNVFPATQHIVGIQVNLPVVAFFGLQNFYLLYVQLQLFFFVGQFICQLALFAF